jgi:uncharacterized protein
MASPASELHVQVCYARPNAPVVHDLTVPQGTVLQDAIKQSGILEEIPEIDLAICRVGIYGKLKALDTVLREGDRIEIYWPLVADPKESRRRRAAKR